MNIKYLQYIYKKYFQYISSLGKLTPTQYRCLLLLNAKEYTQVELSKELNCDRANINKSLDLLIQFGLIENVNKDNNNRVKIYYKAVDPKIIIKEVEMSNVELLEKAIEKFNFNLGIVAKEIADLEKSQIYKIIQNITGDDTDVKVYLGKKAYIVEISWVTGTPDGDEVDFNMISLNEYENRYGRKFEEN